MKVQSCKVHAKLTPFESPWPLQNLIVTLASWGMNRPTPFLKGAFAVIQPLFRKRAFAVILLGAPLNNGDNSETRTGMCYLVGKEDILKWRAHAAHQNKKPDWQLLQRRQRRHLTQSRQLVDRAKLPIPSMYPKSDFGYRYIAIILWFLLFYTLLRWHCTVIYECTTATVAWGDLFWE